MSHMCMSHVTSIKETCTHTHTHAHTHAHTHTLSMSHATCMSHATRMTESRHINKRVTSHVCVMPHMCMSHVTPVHESHHLRHFHTFRILPRPSHLEYFCSLYNSTNPWASLAARIQTTTTSFKKNKNKTTTKTWACLAAKTATLPQTKR